VVMSRNTNRGWYVCISEHTEQPSTETFYRPAVIKTLDGVDLRLCTAEKQNEDRHK